VRAAVGWVVAGGGVADVPAVIEGGRVAAGRRVGMRLGLAVAIAPLTRVLVSFCKLPTHGKQAAKIRPQSTMRVRVERPPVCHARDSVCMMPPPVGQVPS
jgi:hypothetical protein